MTIRTSIIPRNRLDQLLKGPLIPRLMAFAQYGSHAKDRVPDVWRAGVQAWSSARVNQCIWPNLHQIDVEGCSCYTEDGQMSEYATGFADPGVLLEQGEVRQAIDGKGVRFAGLECQH